MKSVLIGESASRTTVGGISRVSALLLLLLLAGCASGERASESDTVEEVRSAAAAAGVLTPDSAADDEASEFTAAEGWTTRSTRNEHQPAGSVTVTDIRAASHDGFDRFVVVLAGEDLPTHTTELSTGPAIQCGSGHPVALPGQALLIFRMDPARAHDDVGSSTLAVRDLRPGLPALLEARMICDFEGHVEWAFGIADAKAFRVLELADPTRIAVDIQH